MGTIRYNQRVSADSSAYWNFHIRPLASSLIIISAVVWCGSCMSTTYSTWQHTQLHSIPSIQQQHATEYLRSTYRTVQKQLNNTVIQSSQSSQLHVVSSKSLTDQETHKVQRQDKVFRHVQTLLLISSSPSPCSQSEFINYYVMLEISSPFFRVINLLWQAIWMILVLYLYIVYLYLYGTYGKQTPVLLLKSILLLRRNRRASEY